MRYAEKKKMLILIMSQLFENGPTFLHEISDLISVTAYPSRPSVIAQHMENKPKGPVLWDLNFFLREQQTQINKGKVAWN